MKWSEYKKEIKSIPESEKDALELMAYLAAIRKSKNITQAQLAERTKLTQAQIARAENMTHTPSLLTVTKIIDGLDIDFGFVDRTTRQLIVI